MNYLNDSRTNFEKNAEIYQEFTLLDNSIKKLQNKITGFLGSENHSPVSLREQIATYNEPVGSQTLSDIAESIEKMLRETYHEFEFFNNLSNYGEYISPSKEAFGVDRGARYGRTVAHSLSALYRTKQVFKDTQDQINSKLDQGHVFRKNETSKLIEDAFFSYWDCSHQVKEIFESLIGNDIKDRALDMVLHMNENLDEQDRKEIPEMLIESVKRLNPDHFDKYSIHTFEPAMKPEDSDNTIRLRIKFMSSVYGEEGAQPRTDIEESLMKITNGFLNQIDYEEVLIDGIKSREAHLKQLRDQSLTPSKHQRSDYDFS